MEHKKHELTTIADILEVVNEENIERFLADFGAFLFSSIQIINGIKSLNPELKDKKPSEIGHSKMIWTDDGKNELTAITIYDKE